MHYLYLYYTKVPVVMIHECHLHALQTKTPIHNTFVETEKRLQLHAIFIVPVIIVFPAGSLFRELLSSGLFFGRTNFPIKDEYI
jgi:hypothetical protein